MNSDLKLARKILRAKRNKLTLLAQQSASTRITNKIISSTIFKRSQNIAMYLAADGEINTWELIQAAFVQNKCVFLPRLDHEQLIFIRYAKDDVLEKNEWQILEPQLDATKIVPAVKLDLAIVPLVGVNPQNFRLGRGKGYYDQTFAFKLANPNAKPYLIGIGYAWQKIEFIPNPWDVPMQKIVTGS